MFKAIKANWGVEKPIWEFTCSSVSDIKTLPTSNCTEEPFKSKGVGVGSVCICTENHGEYMLGADNKWHKIKTYNFEADPPTVTIHFCSYNDWQQYNPDARDVKYSIDGGATWIDIVEEYTTVQTTQIAIDCYMGSITTDYCMGEQSINDRETIPVTEDMTIHAYYSY